MLPRICELSLLEDWKRVCAFAIDPLSFKITQDEQALEHDMQDPTPRDAKGHFVVRCDISNYAYCCKCHIARKLQDEKYIYVRPCAKR